MPTGSLPEHTFLDQCSKVSSLSAYFPCEAYLLCNEVSLPIRNYGRQLASIKHQSNAVNYYLDLTLGYYSLTH